MSPADLLAQGIAAARAGRAEEARATLLKVLEADDHNEVAWLWLSGVFASPDERRVCLENVLTINPGNAHARRGLDQLNREHLPAPVPPPAPPAAPKPGPAPAPAPEPATTPALKLCPAVTLEAPAATLALPAEVVDAAEAEQPCPYCGATTILAQRSCPACRKSLLVRGQPREKRSAALVILVVLYALSSVGALGAGILTIITLVGMASAAATLGLKLPIAPLVGAALGVVAGVGITIALTLGLYRRRRWAFVAHCVSLGLGAVGTAGLIAVSALAGAALADLGTTLGRESSGEALGALGAAAGSIGLTVACNVVILAAYVALTVLSTRDFYGPMMRLSTAGVDATSDPFNKGIAYRDRGMWYMAAHEWELAARAAPRDTTMRHALGLAYAQLGRYEAARDELSVALALASGDAEIARDVALVERRLAAQPEQRGRVAR